VSDIDARPERRRVAARRVLAQVATLGFIAAALTACGDDAQSSGSGGGATVGTSASTGSGGAGSTSSSGSGGEGGGVVPSGKVPVFVAQGHVGTTLLSCDDGQSWKALRSFDAEGHALVCDELAAVRCFEGGCSYRNGSGSCVDTASSCDCDHHPGSGKGLAHGDGAFVATFGWGQPGVVLRSTNGVDWVQVDAGHTYADVAAGNGLVALAERTPAISTDAGLSFAPSTDAGHVPWNVRRLFYFAGAQRFMQAAASGAEHDVRLTSDFQTWSSPVAMPAGCLPIAEATEGGGVIVTRGGGVCRSSDGGASFSLVALPGNADLYSGPVWDRAKFLVWGTDGGIRAYTSADGTSWSSAETNLGGGNRFGEVARNPVSGTMVAARSEWMGWYEDMRWYRSADGISWETLSAADGPATHPIGELVFGYADPSAACPL